MQADLDLVQLVPTIAHMPSLDRLRQYLASDPNNLELLATVADTAIREGLPEMALTHVDHALQLRPGHLQFAYRRAVALRRAGREQEAFDALTVLTTAADAHAVPLYELADLHFQRQEFEAALATLERVIATPDYRLHTPQADLLCIRALHHLGRLDEAIEQAEAALQGQPGRADLTGALATLYLDAERSADAARLYAQAAQTGAVTPELQCVGGYLALQAEDLATARTRFELTLAERPDDGRARLGAGLVAAAEQDLPAAVSQLEQAARCMPSHLGTWNALAWMQLLSGQLDAGEATLEHAKSIDRSFGETYGGLAVVAAMKGNAERAREMIRTAFRLDRNSFSAAYASLLLQHGTSNSQTVRASALEFLAKQPAPGGGSLQKMVLRMAQQGRQVVKP